MSTCMSTRKSERGVTVLMVALSMVALVAMAALSIDVAALYAARGEAQRAADAAALAGAKMFVSSGYTSNPGAWISTFSSLCQNTGAGGTAAVNRQAELAANANLVAGQAPEVTAVTCTLGNPQNPQDPRVTVALRRTNVPTFFVRAVGALLGSAVGTSTVTASATAEAYNISGQSPAVPIQITGVKPWAISNCDPGTAGCPSSGEHYFIDPTTGAVQDHGFVGKKILLSRIFSGSGGGDGGNTLRMYALEYPPSGAMVCPSSLAPSCGTALGAGEEYVRDIACSSPQPFSCGQPIGASPPPQAIPVAPQLTSIGSPTRWGTRCAIHADEEGMNQGQDALSVSSSTPLTLTITGGSNNPDPGLRGVANISRSDSIFTAPIYDGSALCTGGGGFGGGATCNGQAKVIGFLQFAVLQATDQGAVPPQVEVYILNAVGCSQTLVNAWPPANPTDLGSASPIVVRLVRNP